MNSYQCRLIVERDTSSTITWVNSFRAPWKMQFYFNAIGFLPSTSQVSFQYISGSANSMADFLAKQGLIAHVTLMLLLCRLGWFSILLLYQPTLLSCLPLLYIVLLPFFFFKIKFTITAPKQKKVAVDLCQGLDSDFPINSLTLTLSTVSISIMPSLPIMTCI